MVGDYCPSCWSPEQGPLGRTWLCRLCHWLAHRLLSFREHYSCPVTYLSPCYLRDARPESIQLSSFTRVLGVKQWAYNFLKMSSYQCYLVGTSSLTVLLGSFNACCATSCDYLDHNCFYAQLTVRKLCLRESRFPDYSQATERVVLNSDFRDANVFKIHTPS